MARSKRIRCAVSKLSKSGILGIGIAGLVLLVGSRPAGGGPPNPTPSDAHGNTAGGAFALLNNTTGLYNTAFGQGTLYGNTADNYNTALGLNALISTIQQQQQQIDAERRQNAELRQALLAMKDKITALETHNQALRHSIETLREQVTEAP